MNTTHPHYSAADQERLGQIKNLLMLAVSDGQITDSELAVVAAAASREQLTLEQFNQVIDDPDSVRIELPQDEDTKLTYLRDMVSLMMIDGEVTEQEMAICRVYALSLGFQSSVVDGILDSVIEGLSA